MLRRLAPLALVSACGGVAPSAPPAPAPTAQAAPEDDAASSRELTAARAKVIVVAAAAWRRNNTTCPTAHDLSSRYMFAPDTDVDAWGRPLVVECDDAETRVVSTGPGGDDKTVVASKPFSGR